MSNLEYERLMSNARIRLPGALDATLNLELTSVMDEFLQSTSIWTEDITFPVYPDQHMYTLTPDGGYIIRLMHVVNSQGFRQIASMDTPGIIMLKHAPNGTDPNVADIDTTTIKKNPANWVPPAGRGKYVPRDPASRPVDVKPVQPSEHFIANVAKTVTDEYPAWVLNKYWLDILDGLLGRMMSQVAKPYSSPQMAIYHTKKFSTGIQRASVEAQHGNVYRAQKWMFPQAFMRRRFYGF